MVMGYRIRWPAIRILQVEVCRHMCAVEHVVQWTNRRSCFEAFSAVELRAFIGLQHPIVYSHVVEWLPPYQRTSIQYSATALWLAVPYS